MTVETKCTLSDQTIENLQDLIRMNLDSTEGLIEAAKAVSDSRVEDVFRQTATERIKFADQLKRYVSWNEEQPAREQSFASKVHQAWMKCRAKLNGGDAHVILIEAEDGEDQIKAAYEVALKGNPGNAMSEILHAQYAVVKKGHDRIRDLRNEYADEKK